MAEKCSSSIVSSPPVNDVCRLDALTVVSVGKMCKTTIAWSCGSARTTCVRLPYQKSNSTHVSLNSFSCSLKPYPIHTENAMPPKPHPRRSEIVYLLRLRKDLTHREIAESLDVGKSLVAKVAREGGLIRGQGRRAGGYREAILTLAAEKVGKGEIALTVGCTKRLVEMYLLEQQRKNVT